MIEKLKNLGWKQFGGLVLIVIIIIAFGFGGFGGGFSTNNQNNIAKINKTNVYLKSLKKIKISTMKMVLFKELNMKNFYFPTTCQLQCMNYN